MKITKKQLCWIIPVVLLTISIIFYLLIPVFIKSYFNKKIAQFEKEKGAIVIVDNLSVSNLHFNGNVSFSFDKIQIVQNNCKDTLLSIHQGKIVVDILEHFHFQKKLQDVQSQQIMIHLIKNHNYSNFSFLKSKEKSKEESNYGQMIHHYLQKFTDYFPRQLNVNHMQVTTEIDSVVIDYQLKTLKIENHYLSGALAITDSDYTVTHWKLSGNIDKEKQKYFGELTLAEPGHNTGNLPLMKRLKNLDINFNRLSVSLCIDDLADDDATFHLTGEIDSLDFFHHFISDKVIPIDHAAFALDITLLPQVIEIDSTSTLQLNNFSIHPYFHYEKAEKPHLTFIIDEKNRNANQLFEAMPDELFQVIPELNVSGNLDFNVLFDCDFSNIDSLKFDFNIHSADNSFSLGNDIGIITRFNESFEYTFYNNNIPERTFIVGPENPNFCPFENIPPYLTKAILISEDPSFFSHRGFIKVSIRSAMIADLKSNRMIRGGSTITMQLVKNLFLNRKKLLSRKFEEMFLVWMIEDKHLISKERMFEIYVNIIEWGPNVNGINEAAKFYFNKKPMELTLSECMYLASLIRAPKHYVNTLDETGIVKESRREEMLFNAQRMLDRGMITETEFNEFNSFVTTKIATAE